MFAHPDNFYKQIKQKYLVALLLLSNSVIIGCADAFASDSGEHSNKTIFSVEYLLPTEDDRDIDTVNIDLNFYIATLKSIDLSFYYGIAATYATGSITQLEGDLNEGTLREVNFDNSAFGIGPGLLASLRLIDSHQFSLLLNGSGNLFVYSERFPAGGEYYNAMWRAGSVLEYKLTHTKTIGLSYQWTHVSNGQGLTAENPSYEAKGLGLRFTGFF